MMTKVKLLDIRNDARRRVRSQCKTLSAFVYNIAIVVVVSAVCLVRDGALCEAKVFQRCELAQVLHYRHGLGLAEVANWVCIAQHSSGFNTEAYAGGLAGGSHGLFQISDVFWCSPPGKGFACNVPCERLRDDDLTDDLSCMRLIFAEHQRISGDGYNAWNAYQQFCRSGAQAYIAGCFVNKQPTVATHNYAQAASYQQATALSVYSSNSINELLPQEQEGKVYERCELAQELYYRHKMPMEQIPTWVCIAQHESNFDTAAVGRLNVDGSEDHGIFQISDLYWCSQDYYGGKACGMPCHKFRDNDISDDIKCIRRIHNEHTGISGDGFTAWSVYDPYCRNQQYDHISNCFKRQHQQQPQTTALVPHKTHYTLPNIQAHHHHQTNPFFNQPTQATTYYTNNFLYTTTQTHTTSHKGKVFNRCELAQELYFKHKFPMQDISTLVCIVQYESNFNTSAVGCLNGDGSADHGLFQISDLYWCSHDDQGGKACNINCNKLLDNDITDDVHCVKQIYDEHTRISGDGFSAWTVYDRNCRNEPMDKITACFDSTDVLSAESSAPMQHVINAITASSDKPVKKKIYKKCELAQELHYKHKMPMLEIPTWVCIAQHESSYDTSAVGRLNSDGSADHGLFQINDRYWCSHDKYGGKACNIACSKLLDTDLKDDIGCVRTIYDEHARISGDGFTAWTVYDHNCRNQHIDNVRDCFSSKEIEKALETKITPVPNEVNSAIGKGKIYKKCELAQELYYKHKMPMIDIPTWVCIAQYESSFNTAAVGRLNTDGSADHGLFQISDLYWCSHEKSGGKACNIPCDKLLDNDITDDVHCIRIIYEEHTRISGDGFTAWTVYNHNCRNQAIEKVSSCFDSKVISNALENSNKPQHTSHQFAGNTITETDYKPVKKKVYKKCELAQELYYKHKMPMQEIPTWVCIAQHESSFDTSAVGRLNTDGSADHGLFQISDLYWCSHEPHGGKACNIPCHKLLDSDISDDVRCVKIIYEEHTRISGDGFTAWTVYNRNCRNQNLERVSTCFDSKEISKAQHIANTYSHTTQTFNHIAKPTKRIKPHGPLNHPFINNPFLNQFNASHEISADLFTTTTMQTPYLEEPIDVYRKPNYEANPFLQKYIKTASSSDTIRRPAASVSKASQPIHHTTKMPPTAYGSNPFLNKLKHDATQNKITANEKPLVTHTIQRYRENPFLSKIVSHSASFGSTSHTHLKKPASSGSHINAQHIAKEKPIVTHTIQRYRENPFLSKIVNHPADFDNSIHVHAKKPTSHITQQAYTPNISTVTQKPFVGNPFLQKFGASTPLAITTTHHTTKTTPRLTLHATQARPTVKPYISRNFFRTTPATTTTKRPVTYFKETTITTFRPTRKPTTVELTTTSKAKISTTITTPKPTSSTQVHFAPPTKPKITTTPKTTTKWTTTTRRPTTSAAIIHKPHQFTDWKHTTSTARPMTSAAIIHKPHHFTDSKYITTSTRKPIATNTTSNWHSHKSITTSQTTPRMNTQLRSTTIPTKRSSTTWRTPTYQTKYTTTTTKRPSTTWRTPTYQTKSTTTTTKRPNTTLKTPVIQKTTSYANTRSTPKTTTWNWYNNKTPTAPPKKVSNLTSINTTNTPTTTRKTTYKTTRKTAKITTTTTTRKPTTAAARVENNFYLETKPATKATPKSIYNVHSTTTTTKPYNTKSATTHTTTRKPQQQSYSAVNRASNEKYKNDPFSHPFFAKFNEEFAYIKKFATTTTTTKQPQNAQTKFIATNKFITSSN